MRKTKEETTENVLELISCNVTYSGKRTFTAPAQSVGYAEPGEKDISIDMARV